MEQSSMKNIESSANTENDCKSEEYSYLAFNEKTKLKKTKNTIFMSFNGEIFFYDPFDSVYRTFYLPDEVRLNVNNDVQNNCDVCEIYFISLGEGKKHTVLIEMSDGTYLYYDVNSNVKTIQNVFFFKYYDHYLRACLIYMENDSYYLSNLDYSEIIYSFSENQVNGNYFLRENTTDKDKDQTQTNTQIKNPHKRFSHLAFLNIDIVDDGLYNLNFYTSIFYIYYANSLKIHFVNEYDADGRQLLASLTFNNLDLKKKSHVLLSDVFCNYKHIDKKVSDEFNEVYLEKKRKILEIDEQITNLTVNLQQHYEIKDIDQNKKQRTNNQTNNQLSNTPRELDENSEEDSLMEQVDEEPLDAQLQQPAEEQDESDDQTQEQIDNEADDQTQEQIDNEADDQTQEQIDNEADDQTQEQIDNEADDQIDNEADDQIDNESNDQIDNESVDEVNQMETRENTTHITVQVSMPMPMPMSAHHSTESSQVPRVVNNNDSSDFTLTDAEILIIIEDLNIMKAKELEWVQRYENIKANMVQNNESSSKVENSNNNAEMELDDALNDSSNIVQNETSNNAPSMLLNDASIARLNEGSNNKTSDTSNITSGVSEDFADPVSMFIDQEIYIPDANLYKIDYVLIEPGNYIRDHNTGLLYSNTDSFTGMNIFTFIGFYRNFPIDFNHLNMFNISDDLIDVSAPGSNLFIIRSYGAMEIDISTQQIICQYGLDSGKTYGYLFLNYDNEQLYYFSHTSISYEKLKINKKSDLSEIAFLPKGVLNFFLLSKENQIDNSEKEIVFDKDEIYTKIDLNKANNVAKTIYDIIFTLKITEFYNIQMFDMICDEKTLNHIKAYDLTITKKEIAKIMWNDFSNLYFTIDERNVNFYKFKTENTQDLPFFEFYLKFIILYCIKNGYKFPKYFPIQFYTRYLFEIKMNTKSLAYIHALYDYEDYQKLKRNNILFSIDSYTKIKDEKTAGEINLYLYLKNLFNHPGYDSVNRFKSNYVNELFKYIEYDIGPYSFNKRFVEIK
jgi:hypothetical protein